MSPTVTDLAEMMNSGLARLEKHKHKHWERDKTDEGWVTEGKHTDRHWTSERRASREARTLLGSSMTCPKSSHMSPLKRPIPFSPMVGWT